jgi:NAD(P)H dehydrogenase (quinone)
MTIGITGATGKLGRLALGELRTYVDPSDIVALVRTPSKAGDLGVAVREADYAKPDTLVAALTGIDTLLFISSSEVGQRVVQHQNVIDAARAVGVKRIVHTSLLHADVSPLSLAVEHRATEAALRASGVAFTLLRNGWYAENYTGSIPGALAGGAFIGSAGDGRLSLATRADYAAAAAKAAAEPGHEGKTYELAGDDAVTLADLAAEISRQTSRTIPYRNLPEADFSAALQGFGIPAWLANAIASWDIGASNGAMFDDSRQLSALIGRPTTPLSTAVAEALNVKAVLS